MYFSILNNIFSNVMWCIQDTKILNSLSSSCLKFYTENVNNIGSHTVALNMSCLCTEISAWWWLLVTKTCSKLYIIEYIVVFWLNDIVVSTATQWDGCYQKGTYKLSRHIYMVVKPPAPSSIFLFFVSLYDKDICSLKCCC
jgi:hypothetical protein